MGIPGSLTAAEGFSAQEDTAFAAAEAVERLLPVVGPNPDLAVVFFSPHHKENAGALLRELQGRLGPDALVGCSSSGCIGGGGEHQVGPALSIWAARVPGARVQSFQLSLSESGEGGFVRGWPDVGPEASAVLLADPFSFPVDPFLASLRNGDHYPTLLGGLASGANRDGGNILMEGEDLVETGAVGFVMDGAARLQPLVSQGCYPIGETWTVTRSKKNVVLELDGEPAFSVLHDTLGCLAEEERRAFSQAPHVGLHEAGVQNEGGAGSFRVRGIMGMDGDQGSMAVADFVREGMVLQFHARDGAAASQDLDQMLNLAASFHPDPAGALLFSCAGRGIPLFGRADHDISMVHRHFPDLPVSGMFAAGEIGPCGGRPFIHGFAACAGLLVPQEEEPPAP